MVELLSLMQNSWCNKSTEIQRLQETKLASALA